MLRDMKNKRISESATLSVDSASKKLRICLIREGSGSSADYPREFFSEANAAALAEALSFPGHPKDLERPEARDPLSAIATIGSTVDIVQSEVDGMMEFWSDYNPVKSKPEIEPYLREVGSKLGLSIYADSTGHEGPNGKWVAESLDGSDPYKSVDLVVAAGAGGKFARVAESLRKAIETSATAEEEEETHMDKELADRFDKTDGLVQTLTEALAGKHKADLQVQADADAVKKTVESIVKDYAKSEALIRDAKLTESQSATLRGLALAGTSSDDIVSHITDAKKVLTEALALGDADEDEEIEDTKTVVEHLGSSTKGKGAFKLSTPAGFGKVRVNG